MRRPTFKIANVRNSYRQTLHTPIGSACSGELAASISHELKQPITRAPYRCAGQLCDGLTATSRTWTRRAGQRQAIVKDGALAVDIIDRLRSLYKKTPPQRESVDVDEIIGEMVRLLRSEANEYAVSIRTDLPPIFPKSRRTGCNCSRY